MRRGPCFENMTVRTKRKMKKRGKVQAAAKKKKVGPPRCAGEWPYIGGGNQKLKKKGEKGA